MKNIKTIILSALVFMLFSTPVLCSGLNIAAIVGHEQRPTRSTADFTLAVNKKITDTHAAGAFSKYRYNFTTDHAFQGFLGVFLRRSFNKISSMNTSYAFVQTYGNNQMDSDRFSFSLNTQLLKRKTWNLKYTVSYSTETDFTDGKQISSKNTATMRTPFKRIMLQMAHSITYSFDSDHVGMNKIDSQVRYIAGKKSFVSFKYSFAHYSSPRRDSDDILSLTFTKVFN